MFYINKSVKIPDIDVHPPLPSFTYPGGHWHVAYEPSTTQTFIPEQTGHTEFEKKSSN